MNKSIEASYHQQKMWFVDRFETNHIYPHPPIYHNMTLTIKIKGDCDYDRLASIIQNVLSENSIFKTQFRAMEDVPFQYIEENFSIDKTVKELPDAEEDEAKAFLLTERNRPFTFEKSFLIRSCILKLPPITYFQLVLHHAICDRATLSKLYDEITSRYLQGDYSYALTSNPDFYTFSKWQRSVKPEIEKKLLTYWKRKLSNSPRTLLPTPQPRPLIHVYDNDTVQLDMTKKLSSKIQKIQKETQSSCSSIFLAVFQFILSKYTSHNDVIVGYYLDRKQNEQLNSFFGPVNNLLPLRIDLNFSASFLDLIKSVNTNLSEAKRYQQMPFDKLTKLLDLEKDMSSLALCDNIFLFEKADLPRENDSISFERIDQNIGLGKFDISLLVKDFGKTFQLQLTYNSLYFSKQFIEDFLEHFTNVLECISESPKILLKDINMISLQKRNKLISNLNPKPADFPDVLITDLLKEKILEIPGNIALKHNTAEITYKELEKRSTRIAQLLLKRGVKPQEIIAVLLPRSIDLITTIYAILKIGAIYLPLDIDSPYERNLFIIEDSKAKMLIFDDNFTLPSVDGISVLSINTIQSEIPNKESVFPKILPSDAAYIIYTSGTTGRPKGVVITHRNIVRLFMNSASPFDFNSNDIWSFFHSPCFDFSIWELFGALLFGGKLVIIQNEITRDTKLFSKILQEEQISVLNQTPTAFYNLLPYLIDKSNLPYLRCIIFGGESLNLTRLRDFHLKFPNIKLINMYGITEGTIHVTYKEISTLEIDGGKSLIGSPLPTNRCYVLDDCMKFVPLYVQGILYIAGEGVASCYHNNEILTSERFISLPFKPFERAYNTGDIVKINDLYELEYINRIDQQVKLNGYRIELSEIELQLLSINGVFAAHVTLKKDENAIPILCAYLVLKKGMTTIAVKERLVEKIPHYMIPRILTQIDRMPLTPNGKIDTEKLPAPTMSKKGQDESFVPPSTFTESQLTKIWGKVLSIDKIGVHDNFFEIGGNSLNAVHLITNTNAHFGTNTNLSDLFKHPTIESFSKIITPDKSLSSPILAHAPKKDFYPVSSSQQRLFILNSFASIGTTYNVYRVYQCLTPIDEEKLEKTCQELINRHDSLRTYFTFVNDTLVQKILNHAKFQLVKIRSNKDIKEVAREFIQPFDLSISPLFSVASVRTSNKEQYIILNTHHIIVDGVGMAILEKEISDIYQGTELPLPEYQYVDFSDWQNDALSKGLLDSQKNFWLGQLKGDLPILQLTTDFVRPEEMSFEGGLYRFKLCLEDFAKIIRQSQEFESTLSMYIMSVFFLLLHKYTKQSDIIIGCTTSGRTIKGAEAIVGHFLNMLPIRARPFPEQQFSSFLSEVKDFSIKAFENQDYPFDLLVNALNIDRDISRNPVFDVAFIFQNFIDTYGYNSDIKFQNIFNNETSKHDLSLYALVENNDLIFEFEFNKALFKPSSIERMAKHFLNLIHSVVKNPHQKISTLSISDSNEIEKLIYEFNATDKKFDTSATLSSLFEKSALKYPNNTAALTKNSNITYKELNQQANQIAHFLRSVSSKFDTSEEAGKIGVYMNKSINCLICLIGIEKAGFAYVPIDSTYPYERIRTIIEKSQVSILISEKCFIKNINQLQWDIKSLKMLLCADSNDFEEEVEVEKNEKMNSQLWDYISSKAEDEISEGGWKSSYTGKVFSTEEMKEFQENFYKKILPHCKKNKRVLEIGIGSGLSMFKIHTLVKEYVGTDLSKSIIQKNLEKIEERNIENITLYHLAAHELDQLPLTGFDIIIFNSVIQSFHGHNYLRQVLKKTVQLASPHAVIYLGDLLDLDLKSAFIESLLEYQKSFTEKSHIKLDWESELFLNKEFILDLPVSFPEITNIEISKKHYTIENELTKYRFDALLKINKKHPCNKLRTKTRYCRTDLAKFSKDNPNFSIDPQNLAYIIYTSGTTGIPKGVAVSHQPVVNLINWVSNTFKVSHSDRILWSTSLCFDLSVYDIFGLLTVGGSIYIPTREEQQEPTLLVSILRDKEITIWDSAPAALQQLLPVIKREFSEKNQNKLRYIFLSGDWIPIYLPKEMKVTFPSAETISLGGATEATVWSNFYRVTTIEENWKSIPYGKPIQNARYYILDETLSPVSMNIPGDLYIGGKCLAKGYYGDRNLSSLKFLKNPFYKDEKIYKTGDRARWCSDGNIEFLGRKDDQVKIRGYRIEKGEIVTTLKKIPGIEEAHVLVKMDNDKNKYLYAYFIGNQKFDCDYIKQILAQKLPPYMVPSHVMQIESFPLNVNGKIDFKALPDVYSHKTRDSSKVKKPQNVTEEVILKIWKEELNSDYINIYDNFFDLGGNSIKIVKLSEKLKEQFKREFPIVILFQYPTIKSLADYLNNKNQPEKENQNENLTKGKALLKKKFAKKLHLP